MQNQMSQVFLQYGSYLLANNYLINDIPCQTLSLEEIHDIFESRDENVIRGFAFLYLNELFNIWETFCTKENISKLSIFLNSRQVDYNTDLAISSFYLKAYKTSKLDWLVFREEYGPFLPNIDVLFTSQFLSFETENLNVETKIMIFDLILNEITECSNSIQLFALRELNRLLPIDINEKNNTIIWNIAFEISSHYSGSTILQSVLISFFGSIELLRQIKKPEFLNPEKILGAIGLFYALSNEETISLIEYCSDMFSDNYIYAIDNELLEDMEIDQRKCIIEYLNGLNQESLINVLRFIYPLVPYLFDLSSVLFDKLSCIIETILSRDYMLGIQLIRYCGSNLSHQTQQTVLPLIYKYYCDEYAIESAKAISSLLRSGAIISRNEMKQYLSLFSSSNEKLAIATIHSVESLIKSESFDQVLISPIVSFIRDTLQSSSIAIQAQCLSLLSSLSEVDENTVGNMVKSILPVLDLILSNESYISYTHFAAHVVYLLIQVRPSAIKSQIIPFTEKLFAYARSNEEQEKSRGAVGEALAGIISSIDSSKFTEDLISLILRFLSSDDHSLLVSGSTMMIIAHEVISGPLIGELFVATARKSMKITYSPLFNAFITALDLISERTKIPKICVKYAEMIMNGYTDICHDNPLVYWFNRRTPIFCFISKIISYYPNESHQLLLLLITLLEQCIDQMADIVFTPILNNQSLLSTNEISHLISICQKRVFSSKSGAILMFLINQNAHLDVETVISTYTQLEDDDEHKSDLALNILKNIHSDSSIPDTTLIDIISLFPTSPETCGKVAIELIRIIYFYILNPTILLGILNSFIEFLLLPKTEIDAYDIDQKILSDMKNTLKSIIKGNKTIEKEITQSYKGNKTQVNKFNSLLK